MQRFVNGGYTAGSHAAAAKGIVAPHQYTIASGTYLYRFVDLSRKPSKLAADGPWWFEYEHYRTIVSFADRYGYTPGYAARLFAAILYEWSEVDAIVRARVVNGPLMVWKGKGRQVEATGRDERDVATPSGIVTGTRDADGHLPLKAKMTPMQGSLGVLQLFIPGLGWPHRQFDAFMKIEGVERIANHLP